MVNWKNGKQVDPLKEKLPAAEPISDSLKIKYLEFIKPIRTQLDVIQFEEDKISIDIPNNDNPIS